MAEKYKVILTKLELRLRQMRSDGISKLPSEQDLAKEYGCSRQTVRAALDILQQKGLIVKRTGAGSFVADTAFANRTVFFMTEDTDKYITPSLIAELKTCLAQHKFELKAFTTNGKIAGEARVLEQVIKERPAALIIDPVKDLIPNPNNKTIEDIISSGIPVIYYNSTFTPADAIRVSLDNKKGSSILVHRLADLGKKNIACIFRMDDSSGLDRYLGYIDALAELNLPYDEHHCLLLSYKDKKGSIMGNDRIIAQYAAIVTSGVDAVICQNDMVAHDLADILARKGVKIPQEITIASFDNSYYAANDTRFDSLGLAEGFPAKALAKAAVKAAEGKNASNVVIPWEVIK